MRARVYPLLLSAIFAIGWTLPAAAAPPPPAHSVGHARLQPHHGMRALHRAHHIDRQLDRRAAHAAAHGHYRQAARLDRRGDRIVARVERRQHWAHHRHGARFPRG